MDLFIYDQYKEALRGFIRENGQRGYQSLLAEAAGCQRAFISQVLNSHVHLTLDHAAGLARFWNLSELETDYFLELVAFERSGTETLRALTLRKLKNLRRRHSDLAKKFTSASAAEVEISAKYYSSWHWMAIHVLTSIPAYQTSAAIAGRLGLSIEETDRMLSELQKMRFITRTPQGKWKPAKHEVFLSRDSTMTFTNHWNWRQKALHDIQQATEDSVHYSVVQALSRKDLQRLKTLLIDFISRSRELVAPSPEEEMICFCCDLFLV